MTTENDAPRKPNQLVLRLKSSNAIGTLRKAKHYPYRELLHYLGPAFLVSVGYMDPGNWATDLEGGSRFNYSLIWVLLLSNLMAILLQTLSAKLGIVTGRDLAQCCRERFSRPTSLLLWVTAEFAMIATDLAEFLGSAIGIYLLFKIPLLTATLITGLDVLLILALQRYGYRIVEFVIIGFVTVIGWAYVVEVFLAKPEWGLVFYHTFVPTINSESIYIAIGMLGATVMPHNLYLHSAIIQSRLIRGQDNASILKRKLFRYAIIDSALALNAAFLVNASIVIMAAAAFFRRGIEVVSIEQAHATLTPLLGPFSAFIFALALLSAGLSSSTTGTMAGQVVMEGFLNLRIRPWLRRLVTRLVTMVPAIFAIAAGWNPMKILVLSQVVLSFQLPFAIIPLIMFTSNRKLMGEYANKPRTTFLAVAVAAIIIFLNGLLLYEAFGGKF
jgi:manganese transport protein